MLLESRRMPRVVVDTVACIGDRKCLKACPTSVFGLKEPVEPMPFLQQLKITVHGGRQAYVKNELACIACMECVVACPQDAITVTP